MTLVGIPKRLEAGSRTRPLPKGRTVRLRELICAVCAMFVATPAQALIINATFGNGVVGDFAEQASIADAITTIESAYQSSVTADILFQNGSPGTATATSLSTFDEFSYATYVSILTQQFDTSHNAVLSSVLANLQFGNDANGALPVAATSADWRNLGVARSSAAPCLTATGALNCAAGIFDGIITLNTATYTFNFAGVPQTSATVDPVGAFEHEIDEVLGGGDSGTTLLQPSAFTAFGPTDLLRYSGFHKPSHSKTDASYLSIDGGATALVGLIPGFGDFTTFCTDPQGTLCFGVTAPYTATDITMMEAIGYDTISTVAVPEPASIAMFGAGLAALGLMRRKWKWRTAKVGLPPAAERSPEARN